MQPGQSAKKHGTRSGNGVQVIARAAQLLKALQNEPDGLSLNQLSVRVDLPRSTVHRVVSALTQEGLLVAASSSGRVRLGPTLVQLAVASRRELRQELRPYMERLFQELRETVDCAILDGTELRFVDQIAAPHRLKAVSAVGLTLPLHCTSAGKALLAALDEPDASALLPAKLERFTPNTITDRDELFRELDTVRRTGIAYAREERNTGICSAGIAVRDAFGALAALSVPMAPDRFAERKAETKAALLAVRSDAVQALGSDT